ncbi:unnamed protein product [marine sediment metagenome]|uniref:AP2-like integrase N-terminal domain-containing protein n=1 Tax=marine sediment metagenome TaxID=412755 RepID=X1JZF9_9ZZZZ
MTIEIRKQDNGKYLLIGEFEVGNSGHWERRILTSNLSLKKAKELKEKYGE